MRQITYNKKGKTGLHECRILLDDEKKIILKQDCTCWWFQNKCIQRVGKGFNTKYTSMPCKHTLPVIEALYKQKYKFIDKDYTEGEDKLTPKLRNIIMEFYNNECAECGSKDNLEIHRIISGGNYGKYKLDNCRPLCKNCHENFTFHRWNNY